MTTESTNTEHIEQRGAVIGTRLGAACPQGTVCRAFDRSVQLFGDRPAIVDGERAMSYRELGQRADTVARALRSAGVAPGDRVAMLMPNCLEFLPTLFGIWKAGAAFTQLPARGGPADFALILDMVKVRAVIYHERFDEPIAGIRPALNATDLFIRLGSTPGPADTLDLDAITTAAAGGEPLAPPADNDLAMVGVTSGTTGTPKAVLTDHASWSYYAIVAGLEVADTRPGEVFAHVAPLTHFTISFVLPTLIRGGTNVMVDGFTPDAFAGVVQGHGVTATAVVPTIIYALLDSPAALARLGSLRTVVYAGSPMSRHRLADAITALGNVFVQTYAGSEPGFVSCLRKEDHDPDSEQGLERLASAGRAMFHVDVSVQDENDNPVPDGDIGEICVRSPGQMLGYWDSARDAEAMRDGWIHTGDIGRLDPDGYLFIVDRKKDMIVTGGLNVFPAQVEDLLTGHPAVAQCAVIGVPDPKWGEAVTAFCVLRPDTDVSEQELIDKVKAAKGSIWAPKRVEFATSLPMTPTGKTDKKALRAPFWKGRDRAVN
jgi:acyl-CoA synthetase (AMP-forming)/AMP-acid ligase II